MNKKIELTNDEVNLLKYCLPIQSEIFKDVQKISNYDTSIELKSIESILKKLN